MDSKTEIVVYVELAYDGLPSRFMTQAVGARVYKDYDVNPVLPDGGLSYTESGAGYEPPYQAREYVLAVLDLNASTEDEELAQHVTFYGHRDLLGQVVSPVPERYTAQYIVDHYGADDISYCEECCGWYVTQSPHLCHHLRFAYGVISEAEHDAEQATWQHAAHPEARLVVADDAHAAREEHPSLTP